MDTRAESEASPLPSGERDRVRGGATLARKLRVNGTEAERKLWSMLRNRQIRGMKFVRQFPIGPYIADFACREAALIIEVDGGQHDDEVDRARTADLNNEGYAVLRFWNNEVLNNLPGVHEAIVRVLGDDPSPDWRFAPATLSPEGRGTRGVTAATAKQRNARHS
jgi:very-short-patch-repair endonuclease